jgi:hypothetical protein
MRLKSQEQRELNFASRIIQSRCIGIGDDPRSEAERDLTPFDYQKQSALKLSG